MCRGDEANVSFQTVHKDRDWCKMDLICRLGAECLSESGQLIATAFIVRKCQKMVDLIERWYLLAQDYHLLDDSRSIMDNAPGFVEHRHDQSIFSILRKEAGSKILPDETWLAELRARAPIWATRIK